MKESARNDILANSVYGTKTLGPRCPADGLQEWNLEDGLLLFKGKIYVPNDPALRQRIVQLHHDSIASGHPG